MADVLVAATANTLRLDCTSPLNARYILNYIKRHNKTIVLRRKKMRGDESTYGKTVSVVFPSTKDQEFVLLAIKGEFSHLTFENKPIDFEVRGLD